MAKTGEITDVWTEMFGGKPGAGLQKEKTRDGEMLIDNKVAAALGGKPGAGLQKEKTRDGETLIDNKVAAALDVRVTNGPVLNVGTARFACPSCKTQHTLDGIQHSGLMVAIANTDPGDLPPQVTCRCGVKLNLRPQTIEIVGSGLVLK